MDRCRNRRVPGACLHDDKCPHCTAPGRFQPPPCQLYVLSQVSQGSGTKGSLPVFSLRAATASASPAARLAAEALPPSATPPRCRFPDTLVMSWIGRAWPAGVPPSWKKLVSSCVLRACWSAAKGAALISAFHASCKRGGFHRKWVASLRPLMTDYCDKDGTARTTCRCTPNTHYCSISSEHFSAQCVGRSLSCIGLSCFEASLLSLIPSLNRC